MVTSTAIILANVGQNLFHCQANSFIWSTSQPAAHFSVMSGKSCTTHGSRDQSFFPPYTPPLEQFQHLMITVYFGTFIFPRIFVQFYAHVNRFIEQLSYLTRTFAFYVDEKYRKLVKQLEINPPFNKIRIINLILLTVSLLQLLVPAQ